MASERTPAVAPERGTAPAYGWALLETFIVFVVLAGPFFLGVSTDLLILGPLGLIAAYVIWALVAAYWRPSRDLPSKLRTGLFSLAQLASAWLAARGAASLFLGIWLQVAYRPNVNDVGEYGHTVPTRHSFLAPIDFALIVVSVAIFLLASSFFLRRDGESGDDCALRADRVRSLLPAAAATLLLGFAIASVDSVNASAGALSLLLQEANPYRDVGGWFVAGEFPAMPVAILAAAVLLVAFRRAQPAALACLRETRPVAASRVPAVLAALGGIGISLGWLLYIVHIGVTAALGPANMIVGWKVVSGATTDWVAAQSEAGRSPDEIAADLRAHGNWTSAEPDAGLAAFLPGPGENLGELNLASGCSITIDAGVVDSAALRDRDWIREFETDIRPLTDVAYCIRMACPSPVVWHEHSVVVLDSSHPSRNRYWLKVFSLDLFGNGRTVEPGGYCTETGELAESFQG